MNASSLDGAVKANVKEIVISSSWHDNYLSFSVRLGHTRIHKQKCEQLFRDFVQIKWKHLSCQIHWSEYAQFGLLLLISTNSVLNFESTTICLCVAPTFIQIFSSNHNSINFESKIIAIDDHLSSIVIVGCALMNHFLTFVWWKFSIFLTFAHAIIYTKDYVQNLVVNTNDHHLINNLFVLN